MVCGFGWVWFCGGSVVVGICLMDFCGGPVVFDGGWV